MRRQLAMHMEGEPHRLVDSWRMLLVHHWQHHIILAECWDMAQWDATRAVDHAQNTWGIGHVGNMPACHWLVACVQYYAPHIQTAATFTGVELPTGQQLVAQIERAKNRPRGKRRTHCTDYGPGGRKENWG